MNATVSKSLDPSWPRWLVITDHGSIWFRSESTANQYATLIKKGESEKAAQLAKVFCEQ